MAIYVPASRRRRRLLISAAAALVVGVVLGALAGRAIAPTVADRVNHVRDRGRELVARLQALPTEYEQAAAGSGEFAKGGGVDDALGAIDRDLPGVLATAPWLGAAQQNKVRAAVAHVADAARRAVPPKDFAAAVDQAAAAIEEIFGINDKGETP